MSIASTQYSHLDIAAATIRAITALSVDETLELKIATGKIFARYFFRDDSNEDDTPSVVYHQREQRQQ